MTALLATITKLRKEGYTENFDLRKHLLTGQRSALQLTPDEFVVDSQHHFGEAGDPAGTEVVYAISSSSST
ncbi:hypothetical protein GKZ68_00145 [Hymenobacter sp. BRD128]|uniref:hypothetical protein n=1 Tax=Hymenobacter sp. BRD128 TaxID=2675878 RepID=UPI00156503AD|nr:hypothetical protein [Hymenobacter sp. BRD128]QKG55187.1 hypothetical protein GKZ68_00145 [Hymenobacter sp. BRD128]